MISTKKLLRIARKWQRMAAIKGSTLPQVIGTEDTRSWSISSPTAEKGHFAVYSADHRRFLLPLKFLDNEIVIELLKLAEEEFGLSSNQPLTLPCDAEFLEYVIALIKRNVTGDVMEALLMSVATTSACLVSSDVQQEELKDRWLHHRTTIVLQLSGLIPDTRRHAYPLLHPSHGFACQIHALQKLLERSWTSPSTDQKISAVCSDIRRLCSSSFLLRILTPSFLFVETKMISAKKLIKLARKWQRIAAVKRKRILLPQPSESRETTTSCSTTHSVAEKGHFVVYYADKKRFLLPLEYLNNEIIRQLLRLAEEFGLLLWNT